MKVHELLEAISDEDTDMLAQMGYKIVDSKEAGDYTLHLCKMPYPVPGPTSAPVSYELALNKHKHSFTDPQSQLTKYNDPVDRQNLRRAQHEFVKILDTWKRKYGTLAVGSYNPRNVRIYHKLLSKFGANPTFISSMHGVPYFFI